MERGPVGARFAANLRKIRRERGWEQARLAEELEELGHPIGVNSISRLEKGERRADVSDLVALAAALDCSPSRLYLADEPGPDGRLDLTVRQSAEWSRAWAWAAGELPLQSAGAEEDGTRRHRLQDYVREARWRAENRPHDAVGRLTVDEVASVDLGDVVAAIRAARDRGVTPAVIFAYLELLKPMMLAARQDQGDGDGR